MAQFKGTCPACMGGFVLNDVAGRLVMGKHGWSETGGRRVGEYNNAVHVGECFGVGWAPFELSADGTWEFLAVVLFPMVLGDMARAHLLATSTPVLHETTRQGGELKVVEITAENPQYNTYRNRRLRAAEQSAEHNFRAASALCHAAVGWSAQEVQANVPTGPVVHFKHTARRLPLCGSRSVTIGTTEIEDEVTCSRCQKAIRVNNREAEARRQRAADADAVVEFLKANGKQTKAQLKSALGWDTKRVNSAIELAEGGLHRERRVTHLWASNPAAYEAR